MAKPKPKPKPRLQYAVEQRLRMIDFLVAHYGTVNRSALEDYYGISTPQASLDLKRYMEMAPNNIRYDGSQKTYICKPTFQRIWS